MKLPSCAVPAAGQRITSTPVKISTYCLESKLLYEKMLHSILIFLLVFHELIQALLKGWDTWGYQVVTPFNAMEELWKVSTQNTNVSNDFVSATDFLFLISFIWHVLLLFSPTTAPECCMMPVASLHCDIVQYIMIVAIAVVSGPFCLKPGADGSCPPSWSTEDGANFSHRRLWGYIRLHCDPFFS